jgi:hypothetical protein
MLELEVQLHRQSHHRIRLSVLEEEQQLHHQTPHQSH